MFRELIESPVGSVGRTSHKEADDHIQNSDIGKRFAKIVRELGGKTIAQKILDKLDAKGNFKLPEKDIFS